MPPIKKTLVISFSILISACSILATRPVQEMSYTAAAIRAAQEVQADTLAADNFRQAMKWFMQAKQSYRFKSFNDAREYANRARLFAEKAEFEALRNGGNRVEQAVPDPLSSSLANRVASEEAEKPTTQSQAQSNYSYPEPTPTPANPELHVSTPTPTPTATQTPFVGLNPPTTGFPSATTPTTGFPSSTTPTSGFPTMGAGVQTPGSSQTPGMPSSTFPMR